MSENRGEKSFDRFMDRTARLHLPTPAYFSSRLPAHVVDPANQRYWYDNVEACIRRDLNGLMLDERANINGYIVERSTSNQSRLPYRINGKCYTFADALALLTANGRPTGGAGE